VNLVYHAANVARRKLAPLPQGWTVCGWKQSGKEGLVITGGVPRPFQILGGHEGLLFEGELQSLLISFGEIEVELLRYEEKTGKCGDCLGSGKIKPQGSRNTMRRETPCPRCAGTARAPVAGERKVAHG
jgi:hypothetical protein